MSMSLINKKELLQQTAPVTAGQLCIEAQYVNPDYNNATVMGIFTQSNDLVALPVVENERAIGMISRSIFLSQMSRPFYRDIYDKKSCIAFMDKSPLIIDCDSSIEDATSMFLAFFDKFLEGGFIITKEGKYMGIGYGIDFVRFIANLNAVMNEKLEKLVKALEFKADHDYLTGVYNRGAFVSFIKKIQPGQPETIILFDIDEFKNINDEYGHPKGDEVINEIVLRVINTLPPKAIIGRFGGDEFGFLIEDGEFENIYTIIEAIMMDFRNNPLVCIPDRFTSISVGINTHRSGDNFETIYHIADSALYHAKRLGRNKAVIAEVVSDQDGYNFIEIMW